MRLSDKCYKYAINNILLYWQAEPQSSSPLPAFEKVLSVRYPSLFHLFIYVHCLQTNGQRMDYYVPWRF